MITLDNGSEVRTLESFGFMGLLDHSNPSFVSYERKLQYIPGRDAPWDFGVEKRGKEFSIPCKSLNLLESEMQNRINEFNAFAFDMYRQPKNLKLWFDYEDDKFIWVQLKEAFDVGRRSIIKELTLPFVSLDGKKYAQSDAFDPERVPEYDKVAPGDYYANSQVLDWIYRRSYAGFYNHSPFLTNVKFLIWGAIKNASITHQQTNTVLTIPDMTSGAMVVDTKDMTITVNGNTILTGSNQNFFEIAPGNNGFLFRSDNPSARVVFEWFHEF